MHNPGVGNEPGLGGEDLQNHPTNSKGNHGTKNI